MTTPLWQPSAKRLQSTRLTAWQNWLREQYGVSFENYQQLHEWSVADRERFWQSIAYYFDVKFHSPASAILERDQMPGARWFPDSTLNFAENLLRLRTDKAALVSAMTKDLGEILAAEDLSALQIKPKLLKD